MNKLKLERNRLQMITIVNDPTKFEAFTNQLGVEAITRTVKGFIVGLFVGGLVTYLVMVL